MNYKYNGIILNKFDIGETDRLYTIYTREAGKIRAKAIGVKKPNAKLAGNLEPLTYAEIFMAKGKGRGNITGAIAINNFLNIKSDISALQKVFYVFGIFGRLVTEEERDEKIFELLSDYLEAMDKLVGKENQGNRDDSGNKWDIITLGFSFKLLDSLGYKIEVKKCLKCGKKLVAENNYFSGELGGTVCKSCSQEARNKIKISNEAIKLVRIFLNNKLENLVKINISKKDITNLKIVFVQTMEWMV